MNDAWRVILDRIAAMQAGAHSHWRNLWFRGHTRSGWPLRSRVHRDVAEILTAAGEADPPRNEAEKASLLRDQERMLYYRFRSSAWPLLDAGERPPWGILFSMQHHGVSTRLLDWTESFAFALFFALRDVDRERSDEAAIWVLDPEGWNAKITGRAPSLIVVPEELVGGTPNLRRYHPLVFRPVENLPALSVVAPHTNRRMQVQQSRFTLMGDWSTPMEEMPAAATALVKIPLPKAIYPDARAFLQLAGCTNYSLFPDLGGLAQDLAEVKTFSIAEFRAEREGQAPKASDDGA